MKDAHANILELFCFLELFCRGSTSSYIGLELLRIFPSALSDKMAGGFSGAKSKGFSRLSLTPRSFITLKFPSVKQNKKLVDTCLGHFC